VAAAVPWEKISWDERVGERLMVCLRRSFLIVFFCFPFFRVRSTNFD